MNSFKVKDIPLPSYFNKPVYLDENFVVAVTEMPFDKTLADILSEWGFTDVLSEGEIAEDYKSQQSAAAPSDKIELPPSSPTEGEAGKIATAQKLYASFEKYVRTLFDRFSSKNNLDFGILVGNFKIILDFIRKDYRFILQVQSRTAVKDEDYLVFQTMNTTIISIVIGDAMKLSETWLMELGIAALLHEVGMLRLPTESYLGKRALTPEEKKFIYIHPILGYNFLKSFDFPPTVSRAVLEHHERENGSGYPKQKTADQIHLYSKIIAVACSYAAISANRPHREALDTHTGMLELLKNNGKQYNDKVIVALVSALSVFPIGLYVVLSNGKKGQVIDINPKKPYYPIVQIIGLKNPDGSGITVKTSEEGISIIRAISAKEAED